MLVKNMNYTKELLCAHYSLSGKMPVDLITTLIIANILRHTIIQNKLYTLIWLLYTETIQ